MSMVSWRAVMACLASWSFLKASSLELLFYLPHLHGGLSTVSAVLPGQRWVGAGESGSLLSPSPPISLPWRFLGDPHFVGVLLGVDGGGQCAVYFTVKSARSQLGARLRPWWNGPCGGVDGVLVDDLRIGADVHGGGRQQRKVMLAQCLEGMASAWRLRATVW